MPRLTATATRSSIAGANSRRALVFRNKSSAGGGLTTYWGWEPTITADETADTCGVPLAAGEAVVLLGEDANLHRPLYFVTASGTSYIYYTEN
jgi:hypothetical protein